MWWNEKRRPAEWRDLFTSPDAPVTLLGFVAGAVARACGAAIESAQASRHSEAILQRMETYLQRRDRLYGLPAAEADALLAREDLERERLAIQEAKRLGTGTEHA